MNAEASFSLNINSVGAVQTIRDIQQVAREIQIAANGTKKLPSILFRKQRQRKRSVKRFFLLKGIFLQRQLHSVISYLPESQKPLVRYSRFSRDPWTHTRCRNRQKRNSAPRSRRPDTPPTSRRNSSSTTRPNSRT